jgi:hypothetical protein
VVSLAAGSVDATGVASGTCGMGSGVPISDGTFPVGGAVAMVISVSGLGFGRATLLGPLAWFDVAATVRLARLADDISGKSYWDGEWIGRGVYCNGKEGSFDGRC